MRPYILNWIKKQGGTPTPPNLQEKEVTITENGTTNVAPDTGYDGLSGVEVKTNVSGTDLSEYFITSVKAGSQYTSGFARYSLKKIPENIVIDTTQSPYYIMGLFSYLLAITSVPYFDTTGVTSFRYFCNECANLVDVPIYNTASVLGPYGMDKAFSNCPKLSDESLNNILKMCINAVSYSGTKTLASVGLSSTQRTKCQSLSNWNDFVAAGWSA